MTALRISALKAPFKVIVCLALLLCLALPAFADEDADTDAVPVEKSDDASRTPPFRADAGLTKAEGQLAEGKFMQALETLGIVMNHRPGDADALTYTGYAWYQLGDAGKATQYFDRALRYDPKHLGANFYRALVYLDDGDFPRALEQAQVLRMTCGNGDCPELDALQSEMNKAKMGTRAKKAPEKEDAEDKVNK
jgi:Tfp pilus assembly protein PilF